MKKVWIIIAIVVIAITAVVVLMMCCRKDKEVEPQVEDTCQVEDSCAARAGERDKREEKSQETTARDSVRGEDSVYYMKSDSCATGGVRRMKVYNEEDIVGEWIAGTRHEVFYANGSGKKWDTSDDVMEEEAQTFVWTLRNNRIEMLFPMSVGVAVPRIRYLSYVDSVKMIQRDDYGGKFPYQKSERKLEMALN